VVIAPEYQLFYGRRFYGGEELLRTVLDVSPKTINLLSLEEWRNIFKYLPGYSFSKFKPKEYFEAPDVDNCYGRNSFNNFGDEYKHWPLGNRRPSSYHPIKESFNPKVITELKKFRNLVKGKRASLYITFPGLQASSFDILIGQIRQVETELHNNDFSLLGSPQQYKMPDSLVFDAPYHLTKNGLDLRTQLLIQDLRNSGINKFIHFTQCHP